MAATASDTLYTETGNKWLDKQRPAFVRDDDDDGQCAWELEGVAPAEVARSDDELELPQRKRRGRPPAPPGARRSTRHGGGSQKHPLAEDYLSERDVTVLRLGAKGNFNVSFDEFGHVILP